MSYFEFEELDGSIGLLTFDCPGAKVNTLGRPIQEELEQHLTMLEGKTELKGLLLKSGKPGQFIAGADLNELAALAKMTPDEAKGLMERGHAMFNRVSQLPYPTVALIDGACMGGGTEFVLSMDDRIVSDSRKTKIALPETGIGIIPGWGGTQRMPRVIGINAAIDMICGGKPIPPATAVEYGFAFDMVPVDSLLEEGQRRIAHLNETGEWKTHREKMNQPLGLSADELAFAFACAEGNVRGKTKGQYPAPLVALRAMKEGLNLPLVDGLKREVELSNEVVGSLISANLIAVFFMNNGLARDAGVDNKDVKPRDVTRMGALGAGQMGAGIATAHARAGIPATIVDISDDRLAVGMAAAQKTVAGRIKIGRATEQDMANMLSLLSTSTSHDVFSSCDVVVEAVTENEELKTKLFGMIGPKMKDDAILCSNTSTISITRMAKSAPNAERFCGMHFFFPVDRMQLVEVIRGKETSDETVATIVALAKRIKKVPIVCNDCPGFLVNRILLPYMNEAVLMLTEGASMKQIDKVATKFGLPVGPLALHDMVGMDTAYYAGQTMMAGFADRAVVSPLLGAMVEAGRMGKKSGAGFRQYVGRKQKPAEDPAFAEFFEKYRVGAKEFTDQEIEDRLMLPMLLESTRILDENIVREPAHVDMGLILGIGFPPFRGGLLHWSDSEGAGEIMKRLESYQSLGKRFEPTESFTEMANSGKTFF